MKNNDSEVTIRPAVPDDAPALLNIYRPYVEHTAITFEYEVPSEEEFRRRIAHTLERYPYLVTVQDGRPVGYAYAGPFQERAAYDWSVELSIYVAQDHRRSGIGGKLYRTLEEELRRMRIQNLEACIAVPAVSDEYLDRSSVEFHAHLGYRMVGEFERCGYKFGRWYSMVWMEKLIGDHGSAHPVISWPELRSKVKGEIV